jgi:hypothetical protein
MGSRDRFSNKAIHQIENEFLEAGNEQMAGMVYELMRGINYAEDNIRRATSQLQRDLEETVSNLDNGYGVRQISHQAPADLTAAIQAREMGFQHLVWLLGQERVQALVKQA